MMGEQAIIIAHCLRRRRANARWISNF